MRNPRLWMSVLAVVVAGSLIPVADAAAQSTGARPGWTPAKTPWGHPDIEGVYTNKDETNTPLERPDELKGRSAQDFSAADLANLAKQRQALAAKIAGGIGGAETGAGPTHWYEHLQGNGSRPWLIVDPPDGKLPAMTPQALKREAAYAALNNARDGEGRADSWLDRSLYDRCITRGLPGSMMPAIYGNAYEIVQTPEYVAIRYEMIHETRIIPLDGRARVGEGVRQYLGDARGRWEGDTLVVETTNFNGRSHWGYNNRYNSEKFTLTERFTPTSATTLQWQVTFNDPDTWTRPFTFTMPLTRDPSQPVFEYACHEGNLGLEHILKAARAEERVSASTASDATLLPNENLVADGMPPIPASIAEEMRKYSEVRTAAIVDWHPVRREMLVVTRFGDANQLHGVVTPAGARRQLTFFPDRVTEGAYQPTRGDSLVFSKDTGGNEFYQLFRLDLASGDVTLLTDGKSRNRSPVWNRAGNLIAYTSTRRNGTDTDLYVMDPAAPLSNRLLWQVEGGGWRPLAWSPDGRQIAVMEAVSINESYLWSVNATTGERTLITPKGGAEQVAYGGAQFSGDGRGLYITTDQGSEFQQLGYLDLASRRVTPLSAHIPWDVESFQISSDGRTVAFVTNENGISRLHLLDATTGRERTAPQLPVGIIATLVWHSNSRDLGLTLTSARSPGDAYSVDVVTGQLTRWTDGETGGLDTSTLTEPELVKWTAADGQEISGFLYRPSSRFTGKRPVMLNIHGGPESQSRPGFIGRSNYLLNELGVAVLFPNVRGSSGFGKTFLKADNGMNRHKSYQDIGALLDWIKTRPDLDADRVIATGGSYGGHMSLAVATQYNDRIRASLAVVAMSNLVTFLENTESYRRDLRRAEYGDERDPKMRQYMNELSPMALASNITKPMFIIHGQNDPRVPVSEAHQMVKTVRANKTPVWLLIGKNEGHGFARKANVDFQFYAAIQFMREHLLK